MAAVQTAFDFAAAARRAPSPPPTRPEHAATAAKTLEAEHAPSPELLRGVCERELSRRLDHRVQLTVTDNGRTMVSSRDGGDHLRVRVHHMFLDAGPEILDALARYLSLADDVSRELLRRYVKTQSARIQRRRRHTPRVESHGTHHDLAHIYADVNRRYFDGAVAAQIGWSRRSPRAGGRRRRSIKLGSYRARDALIRVHPVLDAAWVPRYFVEYIVYHEMLHHVVPMPDRGGRRTLHGAEFKARERRFEHYQRALAWEQEHLDRLLGG